MISVTLPKSQQQHDLKLTASFCRACWAMGEEGPRAPGLGFVCPKPSLRLDRAVKNQRIPEPKDRNVLVVENRLAEQLLGAFSRLTTDLLWSLTL